MYIESSRLLLLLLLLVLKSFAGDYQFVFEGFLCVSGARRKQSVFLMKETGSEHFFSFNLVDVLTNR
jgi:16S rRNA C1402 (ribose-2'-O) methylase RsmI